MGYYGTGDYYGQGGFLDFAKKAVGFALGALPGGGIVTSAARLGSALLAGGASSGAGAPRPTMLQPLAGPGFIDTTTGGPRASKQWPPRKRRRMNVANPKALRRAIRREQGFVKLAKKALKGTGYHVTRRGSGRARPVNIRESGSGSVIVR